MPTSSRQTSARPPKYSRQSRKDGNDRAFVRINGKRVYLGKYGTLESKQRYAELIGGKFPQTAEPAIKAPPTVSEMIVAYLDHAQSYYRKPDGEVSREYGSVCEAARWLRREAGREPAEEFGPKRLKTIREAMVAEGWTRKFINNQVDRIRRIFRWAAAEELIPPAVPQALGMVPGLRKGRSAAKESSPVRPVSDEVVEATLEYLPQVVADMVTAQRLTGMRPGELVSMRPCDIDRSGKVWLYRPELHKNSHNGHNRIVAIGPKCQEVLARYLVRNPEESCFQPRDSEAKRQAARSANRIVPMTSGNTTGSNRVDSPQRQPGNAYTVASYRRAITRAAKRAGVEVWTPHRLRHTAATEVRREFGLDAAQSVLGHRHAAITEVYAELHTQRAADVAVKIG